jgi:hypothetical protein
MLLVVGSRSPRQIVVIQRNLGGLERSPGTPELNGPLACREFFLQMGARPAGGRSARTTPPQ